MLWYQVSVPAAVSQPLRSSRRRLEASGKVWKPCWQSSRWLAVRRVCSLMTFIFPSPRFTSDVQSLLAVAYGLVFFEVFNHSRITESLTHLLLIQEAWNVQALSVQNSAEEKGATLPDVPGCICSNWIWVSVKVEDLFEDQFFSLLWHEANLLHLFK